MLRRLLWIVVFGAVSGAVRADTLVFAAASLHEALDGVVAQYREGTGRTVTVSYAASSVLARQIEAGAPAAVFVSADRDWMDYLAGRGRLARPPAVVARNDLVLIAPVGSAVRLTIGMGMDLAGALGGGRLALGDPASVPAGKYAKAALRYFGAWHGVESRLAPLENVRVALTDVATGEAPLGIVYATDARQEPRVRVVGVFPAVSHEPIVYPAGRIRGVGGREGDAFYAYLTSKAAVAILARYGFSPP